jgi:ABC-type branched-subunit amino acid transport system ATPase component/ABC-type branched-subunit amino acid transport system permease subunit
MTMSRGARAIAVTGLLVLAILLPAFLGHSPVALGKLNFILSGVMLGVGLNIVLGYAGQLFLGPAAVFGLSSYATAFAADRVNALQSLPAMIGVALGAAVVTSIIIALPALRMGHFYLGMITLVIASLVPTVASQLGIVGRTAGISLIANSSFRQSPRGVALYFVGLSFVVLLVTLSWLVKNSQMGREFRTVRESEHLAASLGVRTYRTKVLAFVIAAPAGAFAAAFYVYSQQFISPGSITTNLSIYLLAGVVIGGAGGVVGPALGVALILAASEFLGRFSQYEGIVFGALLILTAIGQAQGITVAAFVSSWLARRARFRGYREERLDAESSPSADVGSSVESHASQGSPSAADGVSNRLPEAGSLLELRGVSRRFGGIRAVEHLTLSVHAGTVHALVGPNGSGKTTVLNLISRLYAIDEGQIRIDDRRIDGVGAAEVARAGVTRTFQTPKLLGRVSVYENVLLAAEVALGGSPIGSMLRTPRSRSVLRSASQSAVSALNKVGVTDHAQPAAQLSHGTQRLIEVARAIAAGSRFVLLDEPAAGLGDVELRQLKSVVRGLASDGIGVLLVEHNMRLVLDIADEMSVLDKGGLVAHGDPQGVIADPVVASVYLGKSAGQSSVRRSVSVVTSGSRPPTGTQSVDVALRVTDLHAGYGAVSVVNGVTFHVNRSEILAMIGRNGVGKTTTLAAIAGLRYGTNRGSVSVAGRELQAATPPMMVSAGLALVPEGHRIFRDMTVLENLELGGYTNRRGARGVLNSKMEHALSVFPMLKACLNTLAGELSGGQQQMVAVGQAMMSHPAVLLLDEPSSGLAPVVVDGLLAALCTLRDEGLAIVLVEQDLDRALAVCNRYCVIDAGKVVRDGSSESANNEELKRLVLGADPIESPAPPKAHLGAGQ